MATATARWRRRARRHGLGGLELAFPCVICTFVVIILLLCFCCCPLLLHRLSGEIGYDYLALLYFVLALVVFGVVGEALLLARRRLGLPCLCGGQDDQESDDPEVQSPRASDLSGVLRDDVQASKGSRPPPCAVHGPPPAYDFVSEKTRPCKT